eukprot:scaffold138340_cov28-Tisochrysis_lutea.AAC.2
MEWKAACQWDRCARETHAVACVYRLPILVVAEGVCPMRAEGARRQGEGTNDIRRDRGREQRWTGRATPECRNRLNPETPWHGGPPMTASTFSGSGSLLLERRQERQCPSTLVRVRHGGQAKGIQCDGRKGEARALASCS